MGSQRLLPLTFDRQSTFSNYYTTLAHQEIVWKIRHLLQTEEHLWIWGNSGVGKSHLFKALRNLVVYSGSSVAYFSMEMTNISDEFLESTNLSVIIIDEVSAFRKEFGDEYLFLLFAMASKFRIPMALSDRLPPSEIPWTLADVSSRVQACLTYRLSDHSDDDKRMLLIYQAKSRGFHLSPTVANFLLYRLPRDYNTLTQVMDLLDTFVLQEHKALTIPLVKQALNL